MTCYELLENGVSPWLPATRKKLWALESPCGFGIPIWCLSLQADFLECPFSCLGFVGMVIVLALQAKEMSSGMF